MWDVKLAVRSSGVGEDGKDLSCAGQNDTFLGVVGRENIVSSIKQCWASLYSYRSVEYRRQHGLSILASMSVILQEMVEPVTAGVVFTADPLTGEEGKVVITANFGLGETVVGGEAEPDTIVVEMKEGDYKVIKKNIGSKMLQQKMSENGPVETIESQMADNNWCMNDEDA